MSRREIIWHKWEDPLRRVLDACDEEAESSELQKALASFGDDAPGRILMDAEEMKGTGPSIIGPMGIIPLRESNMPSKLYNLWMGHTNFDLDENSVEAIQRVPGVESLDIFTRYRFRIAFGRAFEAEDVREQIEWTMNPPVAQPPKEDRFTPLRRSLGKRHACWAIYVAEDDSLEVAGGKTQDEVTLKGKRFSEKAKQIVTSWS